MAWSSTGTTVSTSKNSMSSLLFSKAGADAIRQIESVDTVEIRGLTEAAAKALVDDTKTNVDSTIQTGYYATIGGEDHSITVRTGTKTETAASRANEANGWVATRTTTTYNVSGLNTDIWKTAFQSGEGGSGSAGVVSVERSSSYVGKLGGRSINMVKTVTVSEYTHLSKSDAERLVSENENSYFYDVTLLYQTFIKVFGGDSYWRTWAWMTVQIGTEKRSVMNKVSESDGWTVTITETNMTWRASGSNDSESQIVRG